MNLLRIILALLLAVNTLIGVSQVGIGTKSPDNSAALHVDSKTKGLLIPRLSTSEINKLVNPADGLLVYDIDLSLFRFWSDDKGVWQILNPMPVGGIIMWSGSEIPYGWALCDGKYYDPANHTKSSSAYVDGWVKVPNLTNRFIMGVNPADVDRYNKAIRTINDTSVVLTDEHLPEHDHAVESNGSHSHTVTVTIGSDTHSHGYNTLTNREAARGGGNDRGSKDTHSGRTDFTTTEDTHNHSASTTVTSDGDHDHGNTTKWGGNASGNANSFDILPPYYTLAFIMRIQ